MTTSGKKPKTPGIHGRIAYAYHDYYKRVIKVGTVDQEGYLYKEVKDEHFLIKAGGYGWDDAILDDATALGIKECKLLVKKTGAIWTAPIKSFYDGGRPCQYGRYESQRHLPRKYWTIKERYRGVTQIGKIPRHRDAPGGEQLSFF